MLLIRKCSSQAISSMESHVEAMFGRFDCRCATVATFAEMALVGPPYVVFLVTIQPNRELTSTGRLSPSGILPEILNSSKNISAPSTRSIVLEVAERRIG